MVFVGACTSASFITWMDTGQPRLIFPQIQRKNILWSYVRKVESESMSRKVVSRV